MRCHWERPSCGRVVSTGLGDGTGFGMKFGRKVDLDTASELFREAADARALSTTFTEKTTVSDLQNFAVALEDAAFALDEEHRLPLRRRR